MYLIVGLGNPEPEYSKTRHNMGFDVINKIAKKSEIEITRTKYNAIYGSGIIENEKVILIKPQTYMNLSGESIKIFMDFYKISPENVLVIYDDMDTEIGTIRIRQKGGAGSHNGMKSVVNHLGTEDFPKIRVGIGRPQDTDFDRINYVIGQIQDEEYEVLSKAQDKAVEAVISYIKNGIEYTMNRFNVKEEKQK